MGIAAERLYEQRKFISIVMGWALLIVAAIFAYWPGLAGPFLLDDHGSIAALGDYGGVVDWRTFKAFVFGGHAGPTGRPLPLLTFLIDANNWPTDAWPFKRTNLVIHLINGVLLGVLVRKILTVLQFEKDSVGWIALVTTLCWLLHPFLVSTTLYAVQRMAQLATLFTFAGLAIYLYGRALLPFNVKKAYWVMSLALVVFTFLAMISKENGILLPLLVGVLEITIVASQGKRLGALNKYWSFAFIIFPSAMIAAYLGTRLFRQDIFAINPPRDFSLYERMLTQPRIITDYLLNWFVPKLYTTGIYQDHFIKSTGLFSPVSTAFNTALHLVIIAAAIVYRRKRPLLALAALFFYAGHLLESTVLNLELYFEHRNYLPASLLFLPPVVLLWKRASARNFAVVAICVGALLGGFTRYSATVWESLPSIVEASARKAPTSARAQAQYSTMLFNAGYEEEAIEVLDHAIAALPYANALLLVNRLIALCNIDSLSQPEFQDVSAVLARTSYDPRLLRAYNEFAKVVVLKRCPEITIQSLEPLFANMLAVPGRYDPNSLEFSNIKFLLGYVYVYSGRPDDALESFEVSLQAKPDASYAMAMASLMATGGWLDGALKLSKTASVLLRDSDVSILRGERVRESDIKQFQETIRLDLETSRGGDISH